MAERLYRSRDDRMLAGVAAGLAETLDADPSLVRIAWAILAIFTGGIAVVVYIVMAIVVPEAQAGTPVATPAAAGWSGAAPTGTPPPPSDVASDRDARRAARRARRGDRDTARGGLVIGLILIVVGGFFLIREFVPWFDWHLWWPIGLIGLGGLLLVVALLPGRSSE